VDCDGVLKLQSTPFKNCIEIETDQEVLFLESVELTLSQLLEGRLNTNKLFLAEDIDKLIEGVTFALAYLQSQGITYKDIDPKTSSTIRETSSCCPTNSSASTPTKK